MFNLRVWLFKRALLKGEPELEVVRTWKTCRLKGVVNKNGERFLTAHKLDSSKKFWIYTKYQLHENGDMIEVKHGKYPYEFVR